MGVPHFDIYRHEGFRRLSPAGKALYYYLANRASSDGLTDSANTQIIQDLGLDIRTLRLQRAELVSAKLIEVQHVSGRYGLQCQYRVHHLWIKEGTPSAPGTSSDPGHSTHPVHPVTGDIPAPNAPASSAPLLGYNPLAKKQQQGGAVSEVPVEDGTQTARRLLLETGYLTQEQTETILAITKGLNGRAVDSIRTGIEYVAEMERKGVPITSHFGYLRQAITKGKATAAQRRSRAHRTSVEQATRQAMDKLARGERLNQLEYNLVNPQLPPDDTSVQCERMVDGTFQYWQEVPA